MNGVVVHPTGKRSKVRCLCEACEIGRSLTRPCCYQPTHRAETPTTESGAA